MSANGCDVTKRATIDFDSIVSGRNYDILTSIIAQLLTSRTFPDLWQKVHVIYEIMTSIINNDVNNLMHKSMVHQNGVQSQGLPNRLPGRPGQPVSSAGLPAHV